MSRKCARIGTDRRGRLSLQRTPQMRGWSRDGRAMHAPTVSAVGRCRSQNGTSKAPSPTTRIVLCNQLQTAGSDPRPVTCTVDKTRERSTDFRQFPSKVRKYPMKIISGVRGTVFPSCRPQKTRESGRYAPCPCERLGNGRSHRTPLRFLHTTRPVR